MIRFLLSMLIVFFSIQQLPAQAVPKKNYVLIISLDGFRWDYPDREITPNLQRLAERGVKALSFQPVFPSKTFPSHYSIVTGLVPQNHGIISNDFFNPQTGRSYRVGDTISVRDDRWYRGETIWETAQREGIKSASFFWPGSETELPYKHPTYFKVYNGKCTHEERMNGIINWLQLPPDSRPQLMFLYFSDTDTYGHRFGPDSGEINNAIGLLDKRIGEIQQKLEQIDMFDSVNIIVLSDHGMTHVYPGKRIDLSKIIETKSLKVSGDGPLVQIFSADKNKLEDLYLLLKESEKGYRVYQKKDIPKYLNYRDHPFIGDLIVLAEPGYSLVKDEQAKEKFKSQGNHGYDGRTVDMHGIFVAAGPAFKSGYRTGTLQSIDIYPLVCKILNITANKMINGQLERIEHVLK